MQMRQAQATDTRADDAAEEAATLTLPRSGQPPLRVKAVEVARHVSHASGFEFEITLYRRSSRGVAIAIGVRGGGQVLEMASAEPSLERALGFTEDVAARLPQMLAQAEQPQSPLDALREALFLNHARRGFGVVAGDAMADWVASFAIRPTA